jgi:hypothetical protein
VVKLIPKITMWFAFALLVVTIIATILTTPGTSDMEIWKTWKVDQQVLGLRSSYAANPADYPPLSRLILHFWPGPATRTSIKTLLLCFLVSTSLIVFIATKRKTSFYWTIGLLAISSVGLGYLDILYAPFLVIAIVSLQKGRLRTFGLTSAIATLIKWQPLIVMPIFYLYLLRTNDDHLRRITPIRRITRSLWPFLSIWASVVFFFGLSPIRASRYNAFTNPYLSGNALNIPWIFGAIQQGLSGFSTFSAVLKDEVPIYVITSTNATAQLLSAILLILFLRRVRTLEDALLTSICLITIYFVFNTGVHENHLFIASLISILCLFWFKRYKSIYIHVIFLSNLNLIFFYGPTGIGLGQHDFNLGLSLPLAVAFSLIGISTILQVFTQVAADPLDL